MFAQGEYRLPTLLKNGGKFNPGREKRRCAKRKGSPNGLLLLAFQETLEVGCALGAGGGVYFGTNGADAALDLLAALLDGFTSRVGEIRRTLL